MLQMAKFLCLFTHSQVKLDDRPPFLFPSVLNPGTLSLGLSTSNTLSFALGQFTNYHNPILKRSENGTSYLHSIKEAHGSSSTFSVSLYKFRVWALSTQLCCQAVLKK